MKPEMNRRKFLAATVASGLLAMVPQTCPGWKCTLPTAWRLSLPAYAPAS